MCSIGNISRADGAQFFPKCFRDIVVGYAGKATLAGVVFSLS